MRKRATCDPQVSTTRHPGIPDP